MNVMEKLCLQWNDFKENTSSSFRELREDKDLTDVTLVCEDGMQVEAHKIILAASSPFFMEIHDLHARFKIGDSFVDCRLPLSRRELKLKGLNGTNQHPGGKAEDKTDKVANAPIEAENFRERKKVEANGSGQASTKPVDIVAISNTPISAEPTDLDCRPERRP